jgi:uncharacterized protein
MRQPVGPLGLVLLQSTGFCNIDCAYCYLPDRSNARHRMSMATAAQAARLIFESGLIKDSVDIVWHAGEPLTLPPAYYDGPSQPSRLPALRACVCTTDFKPTAR